MKNKISMKDYQAYALKVMLPKAWFKMCFPGTKDSIQPGAKSTILEAVNYYKPVYFAKLADKARLDAMSAVKNSKENSWARQLAELNRWYLRNADMPFDANFRYLLACKMLKLGFNEKITEVEHTTRSGTEIIEEKSYSIRKLTNEDLDEIDTFFFKKLCVAVLIAVIVAVKESITIALATLFLIARPFWDLGKHIRFRNIDWNEFFPRIGEYFTDYARHISLPVFRICQKSIFWQADLLCAIFNADKAMRRAIASPEAYVLQLDSSLLESSSSREHSNESDQNTVMHSKKEWMRVMESPKSMLWSSIKGHSFFHKRDASSETLNSDHFTVESPTHHGKTALSLT